MEEISCHPVTLSSLFRVFSNQLARHSLTFLISRHSLRAWGWLHQLGLRLDNTLVSFAQLQSKYHVLLYHFRYLQVRDFIQSNIHNFPKPLLALLDSILQKYRISKGMIFCICSDFIELQSPSML